MSFVMRDPVADLSEPDQKRVITIDRSRRFEPDSIMPSRVKGWKLEEEDPRSQQIGRLDLGAIKLESMLKPGETWIRLEEKRRRLKESGYIPLDAQIFRTLLDNTNMIPMHWKARLPGDRKILIHFDGSTLVHPDGGRNSFHLMWWGEPSGWDWGWKWLGDEQVPGSWADNERSAVLHPPL